MQEDLKMFGNQYTYAVSPPSDISSSGRYTEWTLSKCNATERRLHRRLRHHADPLDAHHSKDSSQLLARRDGGWLGRVHDGAGGLDQLRPAVRVSLPDRVVREFFFSVYAVRFGVVVCFQFQVIFSSGENKNFLIGINRYTKTELGMFAKSITGLLSSVDKSNLFTNRYFQPNELPSSTWLLL